LEARQTCSPEIKLELAETGSEVNDQVFDLTNEAKFEIHDVFVGRNEGQIGTREPLTTTVQIIADEKEVALEDLNHMVNLFETKFTVFESDIAASVEVNSSKVEDPFEGSEFIEESTEVDG
jgi:GTP:adenosylcobinamide-phosphate guanylyltransferase